VRLRRQRLTLSPLLDVKLPPPAVGPP